MFIDKSMKDYITATASGDPTPGGGSVAALAGALGAALTTMVANLTVDKKSFAELSEAHQTAFRGHNEKIIQLREKLSAIVDEDTKAFDKVMEAFAMPKGTDEEKALRTQKIQEGYKIALEVPLRCAEHCVEMLRLQDIFAEIGNINAITDVGTGVLLAYAALEGALFNVTINLSALKDEVFRKEVSDKVDALLSEGKEKKEALLKVVYKRLIG